MDFTISLAAARMNAKKTQEEAAKALGISKNTYCNYENGKTSPSFEMAEKIADVFGIPLVNLRFKS